MLSGTRYTGSFAFLKKFCRYAKLNNRDDVVWSYSKELVPRYEIMQGGPEVLVWVCMSCRGVLPLVRIVGTMKSADYVNRLTT